MYFAIAIFFGWAIRKLFHHDNGESSHHSSLYQKIVNVGLPHVLSVSATYIYYDATHDAKTFVNSDACYTLHKSRLSRDITSNENVANGLLVVFFISNLTIHFFSAPLMAFLVSTSEVKYNVSLWRPYSTLFTFVLEVIVVLGHELGSMIYCGNIWLYAGGSTASSLGFHIILVGFNCFKEKCMKNSEDEEQVSKDENISSFER
ncbi:predicted protein [Chaetoceros tenuissimus]|uniref:Uncharacterized protein n=1 Tax=Chaetoceros tenuissimus TaxID=426638 RepID=A0AAD3CF01_9STRA|nr:predicted protein [Chaetoceros tenuissimus]